ncbi:unnamed protein product [Rhodiola kirilowii]
MQSRIATMEEGKVPIVAAPKLNQPKAIPSRVLQIMFFVVMALGVGLVSLNMLRYFRYKDVVQTIHSGFLLCEEEPLGLERWIRPPTKLMHSMNETELFWRASLVPQIKEYPFVRTPKIAFMFLTKGPLPFAPLWERFFKGHEKLYSIYIHPTPSYTTNFTKDSVFYERQIPSQIAEWGRMSMCEAERRLLANALLDISNEWFILLSEACIPLYNMSTVYNYISQSQYSFMGSYDEPGPYGRGRYNWHMAPEVNITDWRKGSQWFEVNRKLALDIVVDTTYYPKFRVFCTPACYVDEHYFPTMLTIQSPSHLANRSITYVDWSRGGPHPATFGKRDISASFLRKLALSKTCTYNGESTSLCFLFARKCAPSALEPLLELASEVLGF